MIRSEFVSRDGEIPKSELVMDIREQDFQHNI